MARERYRITVTLHRPNLGRGGFQMAARFLGTKQAGRQAGTLRSLDRRVQVTWDHSTGIQYVEHTRSGSVVTKPDTVNLGILLSCDACSLMPAAKPRLTTPFLNY